MSEDRLRLVMVGTGTATVSLERGGPCVLLEAGGYSLAVDLGLGALRGLLKAGVPHQELDCLVFTHLHVDHTAELAGFLFSSKYDRTPRTKPLTLAGGVGFPAFLEGVRSLYGAMVDAPGYRLASLELAPGGGFSAGPFEVLAGPVDHHPSSLAYRVEWKGRSVAVTGDTGPEGALTAFVRGADLLIAEASLPPGDPYPRHLTGGQAGELARRAGVGGLVLTHLNPDSEPAAAAAENFDGPVTLAFDGMEHWLEAVSDPP